MQLFGKINILYKYLKNGKLYSCKHASKYLMYQVRDSALADVSIAPEAVLHLSHLRHVNFYTPSDEKKAHTARVMGTTSIDVHTSLTKLTRTLNRQSHLLTSLASVYLPAARIARKGLSLRSKSIEFTGSHTNYDNNDNNSIKTPC